MKIFVKLSFLLSFVLLSLTGFSQSKVIVLDDAGFKDKVYDFEKEKPWVFKGDKPVIVDFYANWCAPCRKIAPVLEELQKEYGDDIQIYKVNIDRARAVSAAFNITAIPSFLFIPLKGEPHFTKGVFPKSVFVKSIKEVMGVEKVAKKE